MATKTFNTKIALRYDLYENWISNDPVLLPGELALAAVSVKQDGNVQHVPSVLIKCGDGTHKYSELDYVFAKAADVVSHAKSEDSLKAFINGVIADADKASASDMEALAGRVTTAEGKITTLEGKMTTVEGKAADNASAITELQTLVGTDKNVATQIQEAINALNLSTTYEVKGEAAKVQTSLNEYKTSNDAAVQKNATDIAGEISRAKAAEEANANAISAIKDGSTIDSFADVESALAGKEVSGAAAQALIDAKAYADGLASNYDAKGAAATAESNAKAYADGLAGNYDASGSAAQALVDAKAYTDGEIVEWVGDKTVGVQISEAIDGLKLSETYDAKGAAAAVESKLNTYASEAAAAYETKTDASAKLTEAKGYTDTEVAKVQGEVDALETYVGTIPESYTETNVIAYVNKKAEETLAAAQGGSSETAASVKQQLDNYKDENNTRVKAAEDAIDAIEADYLKAADKTELQEAIDVLEGLVGTDKSVSEQIAAITDPLAGRVKTIEDDYLKAADKTELQGNINTVSAAVERLTNGVSAEEVDGVNDLIQYVKDHGTEVTGMKNDIKANADAIDAIEADYLKAADKNELSGLITGLDTRMGAAETAIGTKAAQSDLESAVSRIGTVEGKVSTLEGEMDDAQADILELQGLVGTDKNVATQISEAIEALKIGDYAKAADLTAAINQHNTDKAALEGAIALKANDADLAAIAKTGNVNDLVQTSGDVLIFDCGTSAV